MPYIGHPLAGKHSFVNKFGQSPAIGAGEDIWDGGDAYVWPSSAAAPAMVSTDADDNSSGGATGAKSVTIEGVDASYNYQTETRATHATDGTISVSFTNSFLRVFHAYVATAGSSLTNEGNITISIGAADGAMILASNGRSQMAVYTVPVDYRYAHLPSWYADVQGGGAGVMDLQLQFKEFGGAWQVLDTMSLAGDSYPSMLKNYPLWYQIAARADVRVRVAAISSGTPVAASTLYLAQPYIV
jgi:hypothetical protein